MDGPATDRTAPTPLHGRGRGRSDTHRLAADGPHANGSSTGGSSSGGSSASPEHSEQQGRTSAPGGTHRPLLIAYAEFAPSAAAVLTAARRPVAGRPASVVHVWEPLQQLLVQHWLVGLADHPALDDAETMARGVAEHVADYGAHIATEAGLTAEPMVMRAEAPVGDTVLQVANDLESAVIVLGTHGHDGLRGPDLGRVARHVVTHGARPSLVVASPAGAHTRQAINDLAGLARHACPPTTTHPQRPHPPPLVVIAGTPANTGRPVAST